jgi:hypothetical protein
MSNWKVFLILGITFIVIGTLGIDLISDYARRQTEIKRQEAEKQKETAKATAAREQKEYQKERRRAEKEKIQAEKARRERIAEERTAQQEEERRRTDREQKEARAKAEKEERIRQALGNPPTNYIPGLEARVESFGFFDFQNERYNQGKKNYISGAPRGAVVGWEIGLAFPSKPTPTELTLRIVGYTEEGKKFADTTTQAVIQPSWDHSWHWGPINLDPNITGKVIVDLFCQGTKFARGSFYVK